MSSEVGEGTTFTIRIPNIQRLLNTNGGDLLYEENKSKVLQIKKRKGNVLIVDDEEVICDIFKESLTGADYKVVTTSSGEDAIELVRKNHFDVIFLDLTMPGKSGLDVLREIKALDPSSVIIIVSGRIEEDISNQLIAEGAFSFIHKPFTLDQLHATVASILGAD
ncbi:MAG TPA: response regulator [Thermodesulfobacteriota bacterium]|nr:response regulator [Thermodesulfobacteriota bacterium]